ncbi:MAG: J domain-containing protein [Acidobacteria bacterium]|nr:J domain-containing protein [Acidobacteriota bacterium]
MRDSEPSEDYYKILGAEDDASRDDLERCYKHLALDHHPDRGGDEERMKSLNEAWRVLGDEDSRRVYDSRRGSRVGKYESFRPVTSAAAKADPLSGRIVGAALCLGLGLALLFLVRFQYVLFLWPLALLGAGIVLFGVLMAHGALSFARESVEPTHPVRRFVWAQELAFWSCVAGGIYGVYLAMTAI